MTASGSRKYLLYISGSRCARFSVCEVKTKCLPFCLLKTRANFSYFKAIGKEIYQTFSIDDEVNIWLQKFLSPPKQLSKIVSANKLKCMETSSKKTVQ